MVSDSVPIFHHSPDQFRFRLNISAYNKKGSRHIMFFQCIQDRLSASVLIPGVKGEVKYLFISVAGIVGIVLSQFLYGGVSRWNLPVLLKAQPPVPLGQERNSAAGSTSTVTPPARNRLA